MKTSLKRLPKAATPMITALFSVGLLALAACGSSSTSDTTGSGASTSASTGLTSGSSGSSGSSGTGGSAPSCSALCSMLATLCGAAPQGCDQLCAAATPAERACFASASTCAAASACGSTTTTTSTTTSTSGGSSASSAASSGGMAGTCPSTLKSGETCPTPCVSQHIDGATMCLLTCPGGAACNDATYDYCDSTTGFAAGPLCVPTCTSDSDCTPLGFNGCGMAGFPGAHCI